MKNIRFFKTLNAYRSFIYAEILKTPEFRSHAFYQSLTAFIIDNRAPVFFKASNDHEYAHFSQYYNFVLQRDGYPNDSVSDMFFMHDFVHMAFDNPLQPRRLTFEQFAEIANFNEYVASNETEVRTYFRMPEFRQKSLPYPILYDLLVRRSPRPPTIRELFDLRRSIALDLQDGGFSGEPEAEAIFAFLRRFKANNEVWCKVWYDHFPDVPMGYDQKRACLPIMDYDTFLTCYSSQCTEESYQRNVLYNFQVAFAMLDRSDAPSRFEECEEAAAKLEGVIIMEDAARIFHKQYLASKNQ